MRLGNNLFLVVGGRDMTPKDKQGKQKSISETTDLTQTKKLLHGKINN